LKVVEYGAARLAGNAALPKLDFRPSDSVIYCLIVIRQGGNLFMQAPDSIMHLVETFGNNLDFYKSTQYNEAQLRQEFLDPFFRELGWDMDNRAGLAPQYRDVIHEASIKIGGATKAPDYAFTIHGQYKFFLEAKKPAVNLRDDVDPAYQLRRYGWSAKLPVSILTDFEEFAIYDCRRRPRRNESAATSRIGYFKFSDYPEKWEELHSTFSKDAILKGSFDKYTVDAKRHRGTETVDAAFLEEIENWRNLLARNLALRNPGLTVHDLNFAVQKTIDRLIFLRICEDRGTEDYKRLRALLNGGRIYKRLLELFMQADDRYNSGLFHFSGEKGRGTPDNITPEVEIDDKVLKEIISKLYYPESPYEFSVLPADILGQVYEQFLGKTIRLTAGHQAKIEEKPEVRKAGGVYYTPSYIVDYIVENTLGRLLDGDDPDKPKPIPVSQAAEIKVLDPACGSGSFLIVAYQHLLDWHLRQYTADPASAAPDEGKIRKHSSGNNPKIYQAPGGEWKLSTDERKRILLNSIHGVDIDAQAVEVTKLSLLLKVIEGESQQIQQRDWLRERQRILPDLGDNIQCGNSLIGPDFYDKQQMLLLDDETQYRINVFDWHTAFPEIMKRGGFDCVVGNPPYVRPHNISSTEKQYFWDHYNTFKAKSDLYCCFIERAISLLRDTGVFGNIVSNGWLRLDSFTNLRKLLLSSTDIHTLIDFTGNVFENATVSTCVLLCERSSKPRNNQIINTCTLPAGSNLDQTDFTPISQSTFKNSHGCMFDLSLTEERVSLIQKVHAHSSELAELYKLSFGIKTGDDSKFLGYSQTSDLHKRLLRGENIHRYCGSFKGEFVYYSPAKMRAHRKTARPGTTERYEQPKVLIRDTGGKLESWYDNDSYYVKDVIVVTHPEKDANALLYLTGILNSALLSCYYDLSFPTLHVQRSEVAKLPIRVIDFSNPDDVAKHDKMVGLVERMLDLNKKKAAEKNPETLRRLETQIAATDRQIDRLVYELYELSDEEIELVEGG
jgi:type I restriction-modification system DNA methylase subunit